VTIASMEHAAEITWTADCLARGLPQVPEYVGPVHRPGIAPPWTQDAWSLVCRFDEPPHVQGNPSRASVYFLLPSAPADWLQPGSMLWLWEGATHVATVAILQ
jgi:hypothetical protein